MSDRITQATATAGYGVSESASKVLRNTYMLLSMTLFFSAGMTTLAVSTQAPPMHWLLSLGGMIGLCSPFRRCGTASGLCHWFCIHRFHGLDSRTDDFLLPTST